MMRHAAGGAAPRPAAGRSRRRGLGTRGGPPQRGARLPGVRQHLGAARRPALPLLARLGRAQGAREPAPDAGGPARAALRGGAGGRTNARALADDDRRGGLGRRPRARRSERRSRRVAAAAARRVPAAGRPGVRELARARAVRLAGAVARCSARGGTRRCRRSRRRAGPTARGLADGRTARRGGAPSVARRVRASGPPHGRVGRARVLRPRRAGSPRPPPPCRRWRPA